MHTIKQKCINYPFAWEDNKNGRRSKQMKIYYICECCDEIFSIEENGSGTGKVEIRGICNDCALEMGLQEGPALHSQTYYS